MPTEKNIMRGPLYKAFYEKHLTFSNTALVCIVPINHILCQKERIKQWKNVEKVTLTY